MSRYLAIDLGEKRVGVAISDPSRLIAQPLTTISVKGMEQLIKEIHKILEKYECSKIIVGLPITLKGQHSRKTEEILEIVEKMKSRIQIPIITFDERLTTVQAHATLRATGKKPSMERDKVDQIAAAHLLQSYLNQEKPGRS